MTFKQVYQNISRLSHYEESFIVIAVSGVEMKHILYIQFQPVLLVRQALSSPPQ